MWKTISITDVITYEGARGLPRALLNKKVFLSNKNAEKIGKAAFMHTA